MRPIIKDYARMIAVAIFFLGVFGLASMLLQRTNADNEVEPVQATPVADASKDLLVDVDWLAQRLDDGTAAPIIIDVGEADQYAREYIPGAVHLWWQDTMNLNGAGYGEAFGLASDASYRPEIGASQDQSIVVYDNSGSKWASRLVWQLRTSGYSNAVVLDGGLSAWKGAGNPTTSSPATPSAVASPVDTWVQDNEITTDQLADWLDDPNVVVIDTRSDDQKQDTVNDTIRTGQIPGSLSLPASAVIRDDGTFASPSELREILAPLGLEQENTIVVYGRFGVETGQVWLALRLAGYEDVRVYDDGWITWGYDEDLPIEPIGTPMS
ncbi:MAG TPA: rhodanese-like domain-containing protein [Thermomicrobiales bacterium]|nr:rhodanese-like domain-containing protein [Thermomicrobiales bacterium]